MATFPAFPPWNSYAAHASDSHFASFARAGAPQPYTGHTSRILCLNWSNDGARLASGSHDKMARIWNMERSQLHKDSLSLKGHTDSIDGLVWDPTHSQRLATCSRDKSVRIWDARTAKATQTLETPTGNLNIAWSPTGLHLAVGDKQDRIHLIETRTWTIEKTYAVGTESNQLAWSVTGNVLFVCTGLGQVHVLSHPQMEKIHTIQAQTANIYCIDVDPRGRYFCVGGADALVSCWDIDDGVCVRTMPSMEWPISSVAASFDGKVVASGSEDHHIQLYDLMAGVDLHKIKTDSATTSLAWHPSKYILAFGGDDKRRPGALHVWNAETHKPSSAILAKTTSSASYASSRRPIPVPLPAIDRTRR